MCRIQERAEMSNVIKFPVYRAENQKISVLPKLFTKIYEMYQKRQDQIRQKKLAFLHKQAYQYYFELELAQRPITSDSVDIPYFIYEEQMRKLAYDKASKALLDVIKDCRVNECYTARVKQLKVLGLNFK